MSTLQKIAIVGPESTGKSTLARQLASHFNTLWVPEFARKYIDQLNRPYQQADLLSHCPGTTTIRKRSRTPGPPVPLLRHQPPGDQNLVRRQIRLLRPTDPPAPLPQYLCPPPPHLSRSPLASRSPARRSPPPGRVVRVVPGRAGRGGRSLCGSEGARGRTAPIGTRRFAALKMS
jgi:hypothetical protein